MFAATTSPIRGSSTSHPVSCTITTPSTTPAEVHTSVSRCCASALSVIERNLDPARSDNYQGALQPAREILRLAVAEGVLLVRRTYREGQRPQRRHRGDEVDHRLGRVGKETDGPCKKVGPKFEPYSSHSSGYREHSVAARRPAVRHAPFRHRRLTRGDTPGKPARVSMNVGIAATTSTFYHLPDKLSHKPRDPLLPTP